VRRREFIALVGGAAATWPLAAGAQQTERMRRIGVLAGTAAEADSDVQALHAVFRQTLQQLGWTEGRNVRYEYRARPVGNVDLARRNVAELVALDPDVILAGGATNVGAAGKRRHAQDTQPAKTRISQCSRALIRKSATSPRSTRSILPILILT
jgi:hypothetical protein